MITRLIKLDKFIERATKNYSNQQALILEVDKDINSEEIISFNVIKDTSEIKVFDNKFLKINNGYALWYESNYSGNIKVCQPEWSENILECGDYFYDYENKVINTEYIKMINGNTLKIELKCKVNLYNNILIELSSDNEELFSCIANWDQFNLYTEVDDFGVYVWLEESWGYIDFYLSQDNWYIDFRFMDVLPNLIKKLYIYDEFWDGERDSYSYIYKAEQNYTELQEFNSQQNIIYIPSQYEEYNQYKRTCLVCFKAVNPISEGTIIKFKYL